MNRTPLHCIFHFISVLTLAYTSLEKLLSLRKLNQNQNPLNLNRNRNPPGEVLVKYSKIIFQDILTSFS